MKKIVGFFVLKKNDEKIEDLFSICFHNHN